MVTGLGGAPPAAAGRPSCDLDLPPPQHKSLSKLLATGDVLRSSELYLAGRCCWCWAGDFTKSAQFRFHFWLSERDGGAHTRLGLPAFGDDGEGGRVSASCASTR